MSRISPFSGKRPPRYTETRVIADPETGQEDTLPLQHLDSPLAHLAVDVASRLVMQYVGDPQSGILPTQEFPIAGEMSESLCRTVANIYVMQCPRDDGADIYSPEELLALSLTAEGFWESLRKAVNEVNAAGDSAKNVSRASAGSGSLTPSASTSPTPKSSPEPTPSSVA